MKTHPTRNKIIVSTAAVIGLIFLLAISSCNFLVDDSETSARETQLRETELQLMVRETMQAAQGEPIVENTPEPQQVPTEDLPATQNAQASQSAAAEQTQAAMGADATATQIAASEFNATSEALQQSTAQAETMATVIQQLYEEGTVSRQDGSYFRLEDFDQSVAQIDYIFTYPVGFQAENFVISSNVKWNSASDKANWPTSGCGFYYSKKNPDEFTLGDTSIRLDGFAVIQQWSKGNGKALAAKKASNITVPEGQAEIMLVVYDQRVTFYVNGSQIVTAYDGLIGSGDFGYTISSGTNAGFGTRCQMNNINLWIFE